MAITVNTATPGLGQPSAPKRAFEFDVDLDNAYPAGGYALTALAGFTPIVTPWVPNYDGAALRWLKISAAGKVVVHADDNGGPGAEVAGSTDVSGHTGVVLQCLAE